MRFKMMTKIIFMVILCCGVGLLSGLSTKNAVTDWYTTLTRPPLNPPSWVFGVVWPVLYVLMGIAAGILWSQSTNRNAIIVALALFLFQLILNGLWSPIFFGWHRIGWALVEIILLWSSILATTIVFYSRSRPAGLLLLPYLLWVSFAVYLNGGYWFLNQ